MCTAVCQKLQRCFAPSMHICAAYIDIHTWYTCSVVYVYKMYNGCNINLMLFKNIYII